MATGENYTEQPNKADGIEIVSEVRDNPDTGEKEFITKTKNLDIEKLIGEVQDVPTAYTMLARLKELQDKFGDVAEVPTEQYSLLYRIAQLESKLDTIINDGVKQSGSIDSTQENTSEGSLSASTAVEIVNTQKEIQLLQFLFTVDTDDISKVGLGIYFYDGSGWSRPIAARGSNNIVQTFNTGWASYYGGLFQNTKTDASPYVIELTSSAAGATIKGLKVEIINNDTIAHSYACGAVYNEVT